MAHIFTFFNDEKQLNNLKVSATNSNCVINYIKCDGWKANTDKIKHMKNAICSLDDNEIVCLIDSYDVLSNDNNENIKNKFLTFNCDIVISHEKNCFPPQYRNEMEKISNVFPNSGGYIGYKFAILNMLNELRDATGSDQALFIEYYISNHGKNKITMDLESVLFQSMWLNNLNNLSVKDNVITYEDKAPSFIHFNGKCYLMTGVNTMDLLCKQFK